MRKGTLVLSVIALATTLVAGTAVQAGVLFNDNFNVTANTTDINTELAARQAGGTVTGVSYVTNDITTGQAQLGSTIAPGSLLLKAGVGGNNTAWVSPDHNFTESGKFDISYDIYPQMPAGGGGSWGFFAFGASTMDGIWPTSNLTGILIQGSGDWQLFNNGHIASGNVAATTSGFHNVKFTVDTPDFTGTHDAAVSLYIDGNKIQDFTKTNGYTANKICMMGFDGDPAYYAFDNLTITTPDVPEPTSMLTLFGASAFGGLTMLRRRFKA